MSWANDFGVRLGDYQSGAAADGGADFAGHPGADGHPGRDGDAAVYIDRIVRWSMGRPDAPPPYPDGC